jgi:hypothetical protein
VAFWHGAGGAAYKAKAKTKSNTETEKQKLRMTFSVVFDEITAAA